MCHFNHSILSLSEPSLLCSHHTFFLKSSALFDGLLTRWEVKWSESRSVVSDSLWLHGLYSPWSSPGQNTGVGCHFLLQCMKVKSESEVTQSCPTLSDPMGFSFNIIPSKEIPGLISFRMDWLNLLAGRGTLKSLLQHNTLKWSIFWHSAFFTVQLSHPYMTTGKTITLTRQTFVGKVMSLLFNMLSRLVITFLPRSKRLLISWLQSSSAVILEPPKIKSDTVSTVSPSICHEGTRCHDLSVLNVEL